MWTNNSHSMWMPQLTAWVPYSCKRETTPQKPWLKPVLHPVAYYSATFIPTERNYNIYERELLAIMKALAHWRHYQCRCPIKTTRKRPWWRRQQRHYHYSPTHSLSSNNPRRMNSSTKCQRSQKSNPMNPPWPTYCWPPRKRQDPQKNSRTLLVARNQGLGCWICQRMCNMPTSKILTHKKWTPLYHLPTKENMPPFQVVAMDLITGLPMQRGLDAILTIIDHGCLRAAIFLPCSIHISGAGVAQLYLNHIYPWYGLPRKIISDRDPRFTSHFEKALTKWLGIQQNLSTASHPQMDGLSEWKNQ